MSNVKLAPEKITIMCIIIKLLFVIKVKNINMVLVCLRPTTLVSCKTGYLSNSGL